MKIKVNKYNTTILYQYVPIFIRGVFVSDRSDGKGGWYGLRTRGEEGHGRYSHGMQVAILSYVGNNFFGDILYECVEVLLSVVNWDVSLIEIFIRSNAFTRVNLPVYK